MLHFGVVLVCAPFASNKRQAYIVARAATHCNSTVASGVFQRCSMAILLCKQLLFITALNSAQQRSTALNSARSQRRFFFLFLVFCFKNKNKKQNNKIYLMCVDTILDAGLSSYY
jgi:hypothetical protein